MVNIGNTVQGQGHSNTCVTASPNNQLPVFRAQTNTRPSRLTSRPSPSPLKPPGWQVTFPSSKYPTHSFVLTYSDGVYFALDLQGALVTLVRIDHLFQLSVVDHQALRSLLVLLQKARRRKKNVKKIEPKSSLDNQDGTMEPVQQVVFPGSVTHGGFTAKSLVNLNPYLLQCFCFFVRTTYK